MWDFVYLSRKSILELPVFQVPIMPHVDVISVKT